ncbi:MAG TPA: alkaline phosphatase family protein [Gemmatimonadaceae bacterium]|nr:alkaline phosphatase family protein [Gemmatimonadaceae bacterium]
MPNFVLLPRCRLAALGLLLSACAPATPPATPPAATPAAASAAEHRAIVVSFDSMNERRMLETVDPAAVPTFRALFAGGACTDGARPAFPSLTSPGHAALWTGAYGNVNGIAANSQPVLPQPEHTLLESTSGYSAAALRAEPIWLAAARSGVTVYAHHVTQAPGPPGYPPVRGPEPALAARRAAAESLLALPGVQVVNGYNREIAPAIALTARSAPPHEPGAWRNLDRLGATVSPREIAWAVGRGRDSLFALLYGREQIDRVLVARTRDAAAGVTAVAAPVERAPIAGRALARHFSAPLEVPVDGGRVYVSVRLFDVAPDGSDYLLFIPELQVVEGNRPAVAAAYDAAVRGWYGNSGLHLAERGGLGPMIADGGDGTAELRYLETAEQMTRSFMRGVEWAWTTQRPRLFLTYFPGLDEVDHSPIYGLSVPGVPGYDAARAARLRELRARTWQLADLQLAQLRRFVGDDPNTALFVSGDHGMRVYWRVFQPNVALAQAGLLATDSTGRIDLSRTKALSPNGYWVMLNRTAWKGGIVPPAEEAAVLAAARGALEAARGPDGRPIVTRLWRGDEADSLGIGGPVGGDLYYDVADGYYWSTAATGPLVRDAVPMGAHGFPSVRADMQTVFCMAGVAVPPHRLPRGRTMDVAPSVAEWLGMQPPLDAVGHSILGALLGR